MEVQVETKSTTQNCPYCDKDSEILKLSRPDFSINLCPECNATWLSHKEENVRLYGIRPENKICCLNKNEELYTLCPICDSILTTNYKTYHQECSSPICNYSRRMEGLSPEECTYIKDYKKLRHNIFKKLTQGIDVSEIEQSNLEKMRIKAKEFELNALPSERLSED